MFNIETYENTQDKINKYREQIEILESIKEDVKELLLNIQDNCKHDLILIYRTEETKIGTTKVGKCLICNREFRLYNNRYLDENYNENQINTNCIIDVSNKVSEYSQSIFYSVLVSKAKEKINEMINFAKRNNQEFEVELVKNTIINEIISYDQELKKELKQLSKRNK